MNFENTIPAPKTVEILGDKVEIKQYLPMADKNSILEMVVQTADGGTVINTLALNAIFETYLVMKYTDIEFTQEDKADLFGLYDKLECNGIIEQVIKNIPAIEYKLLKDSLESIVKEYKDYRISAKGCIDTLLLFAPNAAEKLNEAVAQFDSEKIENVVNIAKGAGLRS